MHFPDRIEIPEDVLEIAETLHAAGHEAWCVGGAIRDTLLGEVNTDYDVATSATPEVVKKLFEHTVPVESGSVRWRYELAGVITK